MKQIKNRFLAAMLVLCLLLTTLPITALAAGNVFSVEKSSIAVGDTSTFKVSFTQPTTLTVSGLGLTLNFDKNAFEITSIDHAPYAAMQPDVTGCNNAGNVSIAYTDPTFDAATNVAENTVLLSVHFKVKDGATAGDKTFSITNYKVSGLYDSGSYTFADITPDAAVVGELTKTVTVYKAITSVSAKVNAPVKGAALDTSVTLDSAAAYTGTVDWFKGADTTGSSASGAAEANTVYTAKITLTANSGESFANSLNGTNTGDGYKIKWLSADKLELTKTFPATADKDPATITTPPTANTLTYNGSEQELVTAGTANGGTMQYSLNGTDWSGSIPKGKDAKDYTVYYKAKGNAGYSDSEEKSITVTIDPKDIGDSDVTVNPIAAVTYDGTEKTPEPVVKDGDDSLERDVDYTVIYEDNINAGPATVTIKGKGNYGDQRTENFTINKAAQTITVPTEAQTVSFGNTLDLETLCSSNAPGATLTFAVKGGSTAPSGTSLSGSTVTAGNIEGTFIVTVNSAAVTNYEAAAEREFTVKIVDLPAASVTTTPAAKTGLVYNGTEQALITAGVATGGTMQYSLDGSTWSDSIPKGKDAKPYTVYYRVKGNASHSDYIPSSNTVSVSIDKKPATVTPKSFTITKGDAIPTFELTYTGLVSGDTLTPSATPTFTCFESDGTTPVSTSTPAGTYTITWTNESTTTFTGAGNYDLTKTATATLTIENPSSGGVSTYAITVKDAENGNVTASRKSASKGTTVTLTVTPDKGYVLDTIKALDSKDKEIKLTEKDGKFTFAMPASKVTVETSFKAEAPVVKHPFTDVPEDSWYEDAVIWAVDKGVTSGTSATTFDPDGICTRAQAVTFLWRAAGSPAPTTVSMPFTDVKAGSWYYDAVLWAVEQGITKGTSDITFSPDLNCSRGQIVTFLWRSAKSPVAGAANPFTDVKADAYYAHAVLWAVKAGVTNGSSATTFSPDADCSRAQIVTFIYRHMTK